MQDLSKFSKKRHLQIHSKHLPILVGGLFALNGLVFALGMIIGNREAGDGICPQNDPLASLDAQSAEPSPPAQQKIAFSFHEKLGEKEDSVPTPWSLKAKAEKTEPEQKRIAELQANLQSPAKPIAMPALVEDPIPEKLKRNQKGVYTLQVGSFQVYDDADEMVSRLQRAGHKAFVIRVRAKDGGKPWFRVRVGPFGNKRDAWNYKKMFEEEERLPAFVVKRSAHKIVAG